MKLSRLGAVGAVLCALGCGGIRTGGFVAPFEMAEPEWRPLYSDSAYATALDVAHVFPGPEKDTLEVWYENRHRVMRDEGGKPWNREVIHSLLRCEPLSFK